MFLQVVQYKKRCAELESLTDQQRIDMDRVRVPVSQLSRCKRHLIFNLADE